MKITDKTQNENGLTIFKQGDVVKTTYKERGTVQFVIISRTENGLVPIALDTANLFTSTQPGNIYDFSKEKYGNLYTFDKVSAELIVTNL